MSRSRLLLNLQYSLSFKSSTCDLCTTKTRNYSSRIKMRRFMSHLRTSCKNLTEVYIFSFIVIGISLSSIDSDLEAISHNLTDDSFAALFFQTTALTNYLNHLFLSYFNDLLSRYQFISRVKLTCLTTV